MIVLDASFALAWLLGERRAPMVLNIETALPDIPISVPSHWPVEMAHALRSELRGGEFSPSDFLVIMDQLDRLGLKVEHPVDLDEIGSLAQFAVAHELSAYDAVYVQLAVQQNAILATLDRAMRVAATRLNIPLLPPDS